MTGFNSRAFLVEIVFPKYNISLIVPIVGVYFGVENIKQLLEKVEKNIVFDQRKMEQ